MGYDEREEWLGDCWQNFQELVIAKQLSQKEMIQIQNSLNPAKADNFPGASTSSDTFLLSLLQSLITSLILWQPLTVYITTWIKLWMFTWNVRMGFAPPKLWKFCKKCCQCNHSINNHQLSHHIDSNQTVSVSVVSHKE